MGAACGCCLHPSWEIVGIEEIGKQYNVCETISSGNCNVVYRAVRLKDGEAFAVKVVNKENVDIAAIEKEVAVLEHLGQHESIVGMVDHFEGENSLVFVMELCMGGELFDRICEDGSYGEKAASKLFRQITESVSLLHSKNVVHRDIKPENLLFQSKMWGSALKLADFGMSCFGHTAHSYMIKGTPGFIAPEIFKGHDYTCASDLYALGVILFIMLTGCFPWPDDIIDSLKYIYCPISFDCEEMADLSDDAKNLVMRLTCIDPTCRMTVAELRQHPWVTGETASDVLLPHVIEGISNILARRQFRKGVHAVLALRRFSLTCPRIHQGLFRLGDTDEGQEDVGGGSDVENGIREDAPPVEGFMRITSSGEEFFEGAPAAQERIAMGKDMEQGPYVPGTVAAGE